VELHNTAYSFYPERHVKKPKVLSLKQTIGYLKGKTVKIGAVEKKFANQALPANSVVLVLVDNMDTRIAIWNGRIKNNSEICLYMDGRMSFDTYRLYTARPANEDDIKFYESRLYTQAQAYQETCSERSIVFTPMGLAAEIACNLKKFVKSEPVFKEIIREYFGNTIIANEQIQY